MIDKTCELCSNLVKHGHLFCSQCLDPIEREKNFIARLVVVKRKIDAREPSRRKASKTLKKMFKKHLKEKGDEMTNTIKSIRRKK